MATTTTRDPVTADAPLTPPPVLPLFGELSHLHRTGNRPLRRALETLPEWTAVRDRLLTLGAMAPPRVNRAPFEQEITAYMVDLLDRGETLDVERASAHFRDLKATLDGLSAVNAAIDLTRADLTEQLNRALRSGTDTVYRSLTEQVTAVVSQAREFGHVAGMDAAALLAADMGDEWRRYQTLRTVYRDCWAAQVMMQQRLDFADQILYPELLHLANPVDVFGHWRAWHVDGALVNPANRADRKPLTPPWPTDPNGHASRDADRWFDWFAVTPDATPWAPSTRQFEEAHQQLLDYVLERSGRPARRTEQADPPPVEYVESTARKARTR